MASKIPSASVHVLLLILLALGELRGHASSEEGVQELNSWDKDYQPDNLEMNFDVDENEMQPVDIDDTTEVEDQLYRYKEESDSEDEKRAIRRCGPDVTSWLIGQMNRNKDHTEIKRCRNWYKYFAWPRCLLKFAGLVGNCKPWDFKCTQSFRRGSCPSRQCTRTVTLCGRCVNYDVPGNIHYGWVGRAATIRRWLLLYAADRVQKGGIDDPKDQNAIRIGMDMWDVPRKRSQLCREVASKIRSLNLQGTRGCYRCSTRY